MNNRSPTHNLACMKKMRINIKTYAQKGQFIYLDLFSNPFNDIDFTSLPLSERPPPTYDTSDFFSGLKQISFDSDSSASENLGMLVREIQGSIKANSFSGVVILFDTLNPLMDSLGACEIEVLQFTQTMQEI